MPTTCIPRYPALLAPTCDTLARMSFFPLHAFSGMHADMMWVSLSPSPVKPPSNATVAALVGTEPTVVAMDAPAASSPSEMTPSTREAYSKSQLEAVLDAQRELRAKSAKRRKEEEAHRKQRVRTFEVDMETLWESQVISAWP